jgi:hypothetical protein
LEFFTDHLFFEDGKGFLFKGVSELVFFSFFLKLTLSEQTPFFTFASCQALDKFELLVRPEWEDGAEEVFGEWYGRTVQWYVAFGTYHSYTSNSRTNN